jgi:hypothetical protein
LGGFLLAPGAALGGGANINEMLSDSRASVSAYEPLTSTAFFGCCGRGRYRDPHAQKCRGPADFSN